MNVKYWLKLCRSNKYEYMEYMNKYILYAINIA